MPSESYLKGIEIPFSGKMSFQKVDYNSNFLSKAIECYWVTTFVRTHCGNPDHGGYNGYKFSGCYTEGKKYEVFREQVCTTGFNGGVTFDADDTSYQDYLNNGTSGLYDDDTNTAVNPPCGDARHGCDKDPVGYVKYYVEGLTPNQENWLDGNYPIAKEMQIFLTNEQNSYEAQNQVKEIINSGKDGTLISALPFVKYPPNSNYATIYPKLTEYLKNQLPKIGDNSFVVSVIKKYTNLSEEEIKNQLNWGNGPAIKIQQLGDDPIIGEPFRAEFRKNVDPNSIYLDIDLVNQLENSTPGSELAEAFLFYIGVCVLHEFVHYGDYNYNGDAWIFPQEEGVLFERDVYGYRVWLEDGKIRLIKK